MTATHGHSVFTITRRREPPGRVRSSLLPLPGARSPAESLTSDDTGS